MPASMGKSFTYGLICIYQRANQFVLGHEGNMTVPYPQHHLMQAHSDLQCGDKAH